MSDVTKNLTESLCYKNKSVYEATASATVSAAFDFAEPYKKYLDDAKTEREAVTASIKIAEEAGFVPYRFGMKVKPEAKILSVYLPDESVASYSYVNARGERFLVLGYDAYHDTGCPNFINSYYRQAQLTDWIESCETKLPVVSKKNPSLYFITARSNESTAVLMINMSMDDIRHPVIHLDKKYSNANFVCSHGSLDSDTLQTESIPPFGYVAFELS